MAAVICKVKVIFLKFPQSPSAVILLVISVPARVSEELRLLFDDETATEETERLTTCQSDVTPAGSRKPGEGGPPGSVGAA